MRRRSAPRRPPFGIRWRGPDGTPLASLAVEAGDWWFSRRFAEVDAAHDWGLTPSEFWAASEADQVYMLAYTRARARMSAWDAQQRAREMEKMRPRRGGAVRT